MEVKIPEPGMPPIAITVKVLVRYMTTIYWVEIIISITVGFYAKYLLNRRFSGVC